MKPPIVKRTIKLPDPIRISRYRKAPELGPNLLFFSGGTAINSFSKTLKLYTHNSTHLVTPFDSGGSSAVIRNAFDMPSVGDLRSRLMALADETILGHPEVYTLFTTRLAKDKPNDQLRSELHQLVKGESPLTGKLSEPVKQLICEQLGCFEDAMPSNFDLRGASLGNLVLTGGYLSNHRSFEPTIYLFSQLVGVLGTVQLTTDDNLQLAVELESGETIVGQHHLTGKEHPPISSAVNHLFITRNQKSTKPVSACVSKKAKVLIRQADAICYPPGSFYSSLLANLLPQGVCKEIADNECPKIYIPNLNNDPEQYGLSLDQLIKNLIDQLRKGCDDTISTNRLLNFILIDSKRGDYPSALSMELLESHQIQVLDTQLITDDSSPYYSNQHLAKALLSLT